MITPAEQVEQSSLKLEICKLKQTWKQNAEIPPGLFLFSSRQSLEGLDRESHFFSLRHSHAEQNVTQTLSLLTASQASFIFFLSRGDRGELNNWWVVLWRSTSLPGCHKTESLHARIKGNFARLSPDLGLIAPLSAVALPLGETHLKRMTRFSSVRL